MGRWARFAVPSIICLSFVGFEIRLLEQFNPILVFSNRLAIKSVYTPGTRRILNNSTRGLRLRFGLVYDQGQKKTSYECHR